MTKTAAQALLEYESLVREIPGLKNAHGPIRHPPAGEAFAAGFVAGWDFRGDHGDLAEVRDNFAAMTGEVSRLEAAMEYLEVESALRIAHLEERVLELQLALAKARHDERFVAFDMRKGARGLPLKSLRAVLGAAAHEGTIEAAERVIRDAQRGSGPTSTAGVGSGLRVFTRDRRARELTVAEVESRDPVAHCTTCPECGAPLGDHKPVVLYRVRPEDPLWEVSLRCPPAVPRRTVRDVLDANAVETDVWAAERVVRERDEARRSAGDTTPQIVEWRRAAAEMLGRDPSGTLDSDEEMRTALRAYVEGGDDVRRTLETISVHLHDFEGVSVVDCVMAAADEARRSRRIAESSSDLSRALVISAVATALTRQGVTLPEQPALGDLVAGVRTLGERAQRTIPGKPAVRGVSSATAAEAQLATLFADLIDALGLDPNMTHTTAEIAAQARERMQRIGRLASEAERHRRALASALNQDSACSMDLLIEAALDMRRMGAAPEIRAMRDRLAAELGNLRRNLGAILDPAGEADHTTGSLTELARARVSALENSRGVIDAISKRVSEHDGGSVVEAVHNLSLLAQKRGEALAEALDEWEGWAGNDIDDDDLARIGGLRSLQIRPAPRGEAS